MARMVHWHHRPERQPFLCGACDIEAGKSGGRREILMALQIILWVWQFYARFTRTSLCFNQSRPQVDAIDTPRTSARHLFCFAPLTKL